MENKLSYNIHNITFTLSAASKKQYPQDIDFDIVFAGKSNVGKSSLLNAISNRKKLAKVSSMPGKTATINFFNVDDKLNFVDLPGYGYAKVSKSEVVKWGKMMDEYFSSDRNIKLVLSLMDIRHKPTEKDIQMVNYLKSFGFKFMIIATKLDKIKKSQVEKNLKIIKDAIKDENIYIMPFSSETKQGRDELLEIISNLYKEDMEV